PRRLKEFPHTGEGRAAVAVSFRVFQRAECRESFEPQWHPGNEYGPDHLSRRSPRDPVCGEGPILVPSRGLIPSPQPFREYGQRLVHWSDPVIDRLPNCDVRRVVNLTYHAPYADLATQIVSGSTRNPAACTRSRTSV